MKKLKRTAAGLLLAGVMCVQALPMTAWAVDLTASDVVVTDGDTTVSDTAPVLVEATTNVPIEVQCDTSQTDYFTFEDNGDGNYTVTGTTEAFRELENVSLTLAEDVKFIGEAAFANCTNLKSVDFENEEMVLYKDAFHGCSRLKTVAFEKIVDMLDYAFMGCEKLTTVNLTNTKLGCVGSEAFSGCSSLEDVTISITDKNCEAAQLNGIGQNIFGEGDSFAGTAFVLTFQLNMNKSNMMTISSGFYDSNRIREVRFEGDGEVGIGNMAFRNNTMLRNFDFSHVVVVADDAFEGCTQLSEIQLKNKNLRYIGDAAFLGCTSANDIQIALNDKLEIGEYAFGRRQKSEGNVKPYSMTIYTNNEDAYVLPDDFEREDRLLNTFEVVGNGELYYSDGNFSYCENLTKVNVGNALGFGREAFVNCYKLKSLDLTSAHLFDNEAFKNCAELESLKLGVYDDSQWYEGAFDDIMTATSDEDGNKISSTLELYMNNTERPFELGKKGVNCSANIEFTSMYNLTTVKTYGDGELRLNGGQFSSCRQLESFDFSNVTFIGKYAFVNTGLREAKITRTDIMIENKAFGSCDNLTLYGYTGSTVEAYATANNIPFVALDGGTTTTSTTGQGSSTTTTTVTTQGSSGTILLGDVTLDGRVDISDAVLLNKSIAGSVVLNEQAKDNAECYADGNLDGNDATTLLRFLVHTITSLPVTE